MHKYLDGKVIKIQGNNYTVQTSDKIFNCRLRGRIKKKFQNVKNPVSIGDNVQIFFQYGNEGFIDKVYERRNKISRPLPFRNEIEQVLAVNIDKLIICQSLVDPEIDFHIIDRCLVIGTYNKIKIVICINKIDLGNIDKYEQHIKYYKELGYEVCLTSAITGEGISDFKKALKNSVSALLGPSGVGKSTLINKINPEVNLKTGNVSEKKRRGKHTTTWSEMLNILEDSFIIDMPGLEMFGIWKVRKNELKDTFPELQDSSNCKFRDCRHLSEPGCEVIQNASQNKMLKERLKSYHKIIKSLD